MTIAAYQPAVSKTDMAHIYPPIVDATCPSRRHERPLGCSWGRLYLLASALKQDWELVVTREYGVTAVRLPSSRESMRICLPGSAFGLNRPCLMDFERVDIVGPDSSVAVWLFVDARAFGEIAEIEEAKDGT